jgi:hypothetical protein
MYMIVALGIEKYSSARNEMNLNEFSKSQTSEINLQKPY